MFLEDLARANIWPMSCCVLIRDASGPGAGMAVGDELIVFICNKGGN